MKPPACWPGDGLPEALVLAGPAGVVFDRALALDGDEEVADLHTEEHPSHWILQGVCLVLRIK